MRYRRARVVGGTCFFTVNLAERQRRLLVDHIDLLREVVRKAKAAHPFRIDAMVILRDHLHAVWTLPEGNADYATRWALIKAGFSPQRAMGKRLSQIRLTKGERGIWQRRYWKHLVRDDADYAQQVDHIHCNPVKHGYVCQGKEWSCSSFHRYVGLGILPDNWACASDSDLEAGELESWGSRRPPQPTTNNLGA